MNVLIRLYADSPHAPLDVTLALDASDIARMREALKALEDCNGLSMELWIEQLSDEVTLLPSELEALHALEEVEAQPKLPLRLAKTGHELRRAVYDFEKEGVIVERDGSVWYHGKERQGFDGNGRIGLLAELVVEAGV